MKYDAAKLLKLGDRILFSIQVLDKFETGCIMAKRNLKTNFPMIYFKIISDDKNVDGLRGAFEDEIIMLLDESS